MKDLVPRLPHSCIKGAGKGGCNMDHELFSGNAKIERKTILFSLRENARGRFLRITEDMGGHKDSIIIPSTGLPVLLDLLKATMAADASAGPPRIAEASESDRS